MEIKSMKMAKRHKAGGLMIPTVVAALLMAAALMGCSTGGVVPRESVTGLAVRADAVGQDNGSLTSSFPTAGEYQRMGRHAVNYSEQAEAGPRVEFHAPILER